jgi:hypothetical protein
MSRFERGYHSVAKIQESPTSRVTLDPILSEHIPLEEINFNIRSMQRRMDRAGIRDTKITGYEGPVSTFTQIPRGLKSGKLDVVSREKTAVTHYVVFTPIQPLDSPDYVAGRWYDATVKLNFSEIKRRIIATGQPSDSPKGWTPWIERALKNEFVATASSRDFSYSSENDFPKPRVDTRNAVISAIATIVSGAATLPIDINVVPPIMVGAYLLSRVSAEVANRIDYARNNYPSQKFKWSFLPYEMDRAVPLLIARKKRMVKPRSEINPT